MTTYKQLLLARLSEDGWEQNESIDIDEWWAEACWQVRSTKQNWGLELFITFLIDPQWDGEHTGDKPPVWAIVATERLPASWRPSDKVALLSMSKRHFATKLEEFAAALDTFRNAPSSQSLSNASERSARETKACDECGSDYFADASKMAALCPECSHRLYGYPNCEHDFQQRRCTRCHWDGSVSSFSKDRENAKRPLPRDIEAEVYFLTPEEGGRKTPAFDGYRPQFHYDGQDWDAPLELADVETAAPGSTVRAFFAFMSPAKHFGKIEVGTPFELREGPRSVARGCVTRLLGLEHSAKATK